METAQASTPCKPPEALSTPAAWLVLAAIGTCLGGGMIALQLNIHALLVLVCMGLAAFGWLLGRRFVELRAAMLASIGHGQSAMILFILIGMMVGAWAQSGTLAALMFYGLKVLSPSIFLPSALWVCVVLTVPTGSAWGTAATVGVALMGIGAALGFPAPWVAGAVVAGATFGDKLSPISDTTNLAASAAGTPLQRHIAGMLPSSLVSLALATLAFAWLGMGHTGLGAGVANSQEASLLGLQTMQAAQDALAAARSISWILLVPALFVGGMSLLRVPAEPTMTVGILAAVALSLGMHGESLPQILEALGTGYRSDTGVVMVDKLLTRGGIQGMMWTLSLAILALALGGLLAHLGVLRAAMAPVLRWSDMRTQKLSQSSAQKMWVPLGIGMGILTNMALAEAYLSIILNGRLLKEPFARAGLKPHQLSRVLEQGATLTTPLIPWSTAGAYYLGVLGVSPAAYFPFAFYNIFEPLLAMLWVLFLSSTWWRPSQRVKISTTH